MKGKSHMRLSCTQNPSINTRGRGEGCVSKTRDFKERTKLQNLNLEGVGKGKLCRISRKKPYSPQGRSSEIPSRRGEGWLKILEAKYEDKLEFPGRRGGAKQKNLPWGEYGYFLEL